MRTIQHTLLAEGEFRRSVLTIGNFDGVHLGHRALLRAVRERAVSLSAASVVYTFHPHPLKVLNPSFCPPLLTSFEDRLALIAAEEIDAVVWAQFDRQYASIDPELFARELFGAKLGATEVWVGPDFAFGRGRKGSVELLRRVAGEFGASVRVIETFSLSGEVVSSTRIRQAVAEADFDTAARLLGRPYAIHGPVVHGAQRGRGLGFPTANILPREECLPPPGVYAAWARTGGRECPAAVNLGPNPTFGAAETTLEAFLLDFEGDLYGADLELVFEQAVRDEIAFQDPAALVEQIKRDVAEVRAILRKGRRVYGEATP